VVGDLQAVIIFITNFIFLFALIIFVLGAGIRVAGILTASPKISPDSIDEQFIRLLCRIFSIVAAIVSFIEVGKYMGLPLSTLLAGAGVGGFAVALAAQDTLKNVFGSIMIFLDKPYRVGERIRVAGHYGTVEEIGLRSTKMRLLTGHVTTIPNEKMAASDIENIGRRPYIRRVTDIYLPLDITPGKAQQAVDICSDILKDHEGQREPLLPRVFLHEFQRDCISIRIMYWFHPPVHWEFMAFGQKVNKLIMERFAAADIQFALPTTRSLIAQEKDTEFSVAS
jgi:MscS family membrane protein